MQLNSILCLLIGTVMCTLPVDAYCQDELPEVVVKVLVQDEEGKSIKDATVKVGFRSPRGGRQAGTTKEDVIGMTDQHRLFTARHRAFPGASLAAFKNGYYTSSTTLRPITFEDGRWIQDDAVHTIVLRGKVKPIPMYARRLNDKKIPLVQEPMGYDLMRGDWVGPYGKGTTPDLTVTLVKREYLDCSNYEGILELSFPGSGNGISPIPVSKLIPESELVLPREAVSDGYVPVIRIALLENRTSNFVRSSTPHEEDNYFVRIRAHLDGEGNVTVANYGKIAGPIDFNLHNTDTATVDFSYYINPEANDRNVEFDRKRNLFTDIEYTLENVRKP